MLLFFEHLSCVDTYAHMGEGILKLCILETINNGRFDLFSSFSYKTIAIIGLILAY